MPSSKKRIFQIAKELNISHNEIINFLKNNGIEVASLMSEVDEESYKKILSEFSKEKLQIDRFRKEQARQAIVDTRRKTDQSKNPLADIDESVKKVSKSTKIENKINLQDSIKKEADRLRKEREKEVGKNELSETDKNVSNKKASIKKDNDKSANLERTKIHDKKQALKDIISGQHTMKKVDISSIAEKLNQNKKKTDKTNKKPSNTSVPIFNKRPSKKKYKKVDKKELEVIDSNLKKTLSIPEFSTVDELAQSMEKDSSEIIMTCMQMGMMVTINQRLDMDSITLIADEFGYNVEALEEYGEDIIENVTNHVDNSKAVPRPPVVTVMGHVDHGKTSLLDYVREENVVAGESGGITQHIGAYEVTVKDGNKITFIDTPGHEAFTAMRARGAQVTDIVIVVVAADDSVKPQTLEAIHHAQAANVPMIIAINKIDKPNADIENVKRALTEENVIVEDYGGKIQCSEISAKNGTGIDELLDKIILEAEVLDLKAVKDVPAKGIVVESKLDKGLGPISTILVQEGTLNIGDVFVCGTQYSKVRSILNERSQKLKDAFPSDPVQILGFESVPNAGDSFVVLNDEREARKIALHRSQLKREAEQRRFKHRTLEQIGQQIAEGTVSNLDVIIKGDVDGSIEALSDSLMSLNFKEVAVNIIHRAVGMITENDVSLAAASNAIIIAFNVNTSPEAKMASRNKGIDIRNYSIIYDAVDEVKLALEGLLKPEQIENAIGIAEVRVIYKIGRKSSIAGSFIKTGKAIRNAKLRIVRNDETIYKGKLTSLKRNKDDASEVLEGYECGIAVDGFNDFHENDLIEFYEIKEVKRSLT